MDFSGLKGMTLVAIVRNRDDDELTFTTSKGLVFKMFHQQDWCEGVYIEDICGDLDDLLYEPILRSEERCEDKEDACESGTWTFYELATIKGSVTIRWLGESNGYYSETVDFEQMKSVNPVRMAVSSATGTKVH